MVNYANVTYFAVRGVDYCLGFLVRGFIPGFLFAVSCHRPDEIKKVIKIASYMFLALALIGLVEILTQTKSFSIFGAVHSLMIAKMPPTDLSMTPPLGSVGNRIPFACSLLAGLSLWIPWLNFISLIVIVLSQSRSAWLGALVVLALQIFLVRNKKLKSLLSFIVGVGATLTLVFILKPTIRHQFLGKLFSFQQNEVGIQNRLASFSLAKKAIQSHKLFGIGFGDYNTANLTVADNQYLRWLVETGVFGFCGLLAFLGLTLGLAWRKIRNAQDGDKNDLLVALVSGFIGIAVSFLFFDGFGWNAIHVTFWSLAGLIWASSF